MFPFLSILAPAVFLTCPCLHDHHGDWLVYHDGKRTEKKINSNNKSLIFILSWGKSSLSCSNTVSTGVLSVGVILPTSRFLVHRLKAGGCGEKEMVNPLPVQWYLQFGVSLLTAYYYFLIYYLSCSSIHSVQVL